MSGKIGIRTKILANTAVISLTIAIVLMLVMMFFMYSLTSSILLETLQPMAKSASQSIESNLHMMADRIFMIGDNASFTDPLIDKADKQALLDKAKSGVEFVWLGLYQPDGSLYTGSSDCPSSLASSDHFRLLQETANLAIDDTRVSGNTLEIVIGTPLFDASKAAVYYLVGSYQYDVLNDVLSNINVGNNGTVFIINDEGKLMAHHEPQKVIDGQTIFTEFGSSEEIATLVKNMASAQTNVMKIGSYFDSRYFSYSPVRGTHWSLCITSPQSDFMAPANNAIFTSLGITLVLLCFAAVMMVRLALKIQRPLGRVTQRITALAEGDLHTWIEVEKTKDETEILSQALLDTVKSINSYTSELSRVLSELSQSNLNVSVEKEFKGDFIVMKNSLNQIVEFLNQIMHSIQTAAVEVSNTSYRVHENAIHIQSSSSGQAESLAKLHEETVIISRNVDEVDKHTETMRSFMEKAVGSMSEGKVHMADMLDSMNQISMDSEEIKKINRILEEIAMQTNLLAFNASIEAANAGAAGRGFAVVAREIGELAAKSQASSRQTAEIIENSRRAIEEGVARANQTAHSINAIADISGRVAGISQQLSEAVATEKTALENITEQMGEINLLAKNNLEYSRQSADASETLTGQSDALQGMVRRFSLKG